MVEKNPDKTDPLSDTIQKTDRVLAGVQTSLNLGYLLVIYLIGSIFLYIILYIFIPEFSDEMFNILFWLTFLIFTLLALIWLALTSGLRKEIHILRWDQSRLKTSIRYELAPKSGATPEQIIRNLMFEVFEDLSKYYDTMPDRVNYNVSTKSGYVIDWTYTYSKRILMTKLFDKNDIIKEKDLIELKKEALSIAGTKKIVKIIVISKSMFGEDAIMFARKQDIIKGKTPIDLILEKQDGYSSIFICGHEL